MNQLTRSIFGAAIGIAVMFAGRSSFAQDQATPPHSATTIPATARFEIIQSHLVAKWTFRLDRYCGNVSQLVKTKDDDVAWESMPILDLPKCTPDGKVRYQIFSSSLAARHTFLMNLDSGKTWVLSSIKNEKAGEFPAWLPFAK